MCFSANASFGSGLILAVIGVATVKKSISTKQIIFGSIPLIFSIQQLIEGVVWLTIGNKEYLNLSKVSIYIFLFFAQVVWPIVVPLSIYYMNKKDSYKLIQQFFVGVGLTISLYLFLCIIYYDVSAEIIDQHIVYHQGSPMVSIGNIVAFLYVLATILPPFFSKIKFMNLLGIINLMAFSVSCFFYAYYIVSIWCFFASLMSISIWFILKNLNKKKQYRLSE